MLVIGGLGATTVDAVGTGTAWGTCGEMVQAFLADGQPFHVTCPIDKSATVTVKLTRSPEFVVEIAGDNTQKLQLALLATAEYLDIEPCRIRAAHWSDLSIGKGMGSSTADITAGARALAAAVGETLNSTELANIATNIESSDGSMHEGIVAFNQKTGALIRRFDWWPEFLVAMVVPANTLNTESAQLGEKAKLRQEGQALLDGIDRAVANRSVTEFAQVTTESARFNQHFVPNSLCTLVIDRLEEFGAIGLNIGHTGTVMGLLFDAHDPDAMRKAASATIELQAMAPTAVVDVVKTPPAITL